MMPHDTTLTFRTIEPGAVIEPGVLVEFKDSAGQRHYIRRGDRAPPGVPPGHITIGNVYNNVLLTRPDRAALARFLIHFAETGQFSA